MNRMKRQKDMTLKDELPRSGGVQYATEEEWRNNSRKNEQTEPKWKQHPFVDMSGNESKVWCCKGKWYREPGMLGPWIKIKLEVVKQEMARMNIDILGISELKWTGMGKFNSDDHYVCHCGQESLRRNGTALIVSKSLKCSTWMQSQKWQNDIC